MGSELTKEEAHQDIEKEEENKHEKLKSFEQIVQEITDLPEDLKPYLKNICYFDKKYQKQYVYNDIIYSRSNVFYLYPITVKDTLKVNLFQPDTHEFQKTLVKKIYFLSSKYDVNPYDLMIYFEPFKTTCFIFNKEWELIPIRYFYHKKFIDSVLHVNFKYQDKLLSGTFLHMNEFEIDEHELKWNEIINLYNIHLPFDFKQNLVDISIKNRTNLNFHIKLKDQSLKLGDMIFKNIQIKSNLLLGELDPKNGEGSIKCKIDDKTITFKFQGEKECIKSFIPKDYMFINNSSSTFRIKGLFSIQNFQINLDFQSFTSYYYFRMNKIIVKVKNNIKSAIIKNDGDNIKVYDKGFKRNGISANSFSFFSLLDFCDVFKVPTRPLMKDYGILRIISSKISSSAIILKGEAFQYDIKAYLPLIIMYSLIDDTFEISIDYYKILFYESLLLQILKRYKGDIQFKFH